ncbi:hypothetical protein CTI14_59285, partial [Methylobacterium radiotolerans]
RAAAPGRLHRLRGLGGQPPGRRRAAHAAERGRGCAAPCRRSRPLVSLDLWSLLRLNLQPRSIEFRETQTTALLHRDGSIAFAASEANHPVDVAPHTPPSVDG